MGVSHSKQSLDISSTPKKAEVNGKAAVEEVKTEDKITVKLEMVSCRRLERIFLLHSLPTSLH